MNDLCLICVRRCTSAINLFRSAFPPAMPQSSPPELSLCSCAKCLEQDPEGVWLTRKHFKIHQDQALSSQLRSHLQPLAHHDNDVASSILASGLEPTVSPRAASSTPVWSHSGPGPGFPPEPLTSPATSSESQLLDVRLELQEIRYQTLELDDLRPLDLVFARVPTTTAIPEQFSGAYQYDGNLNAAPFDLTRCPANAVFLDREFRLHNLSCRLDKLGPRVEERDPNVKLRLSSTRKEVSLALNKLYDWKKQLWWKKATDLKENLAQGPSSAVIEVPCIESSTCIIGTDHFRH